LAARRAVMDSLKRRRFLECLKVDTERIRFSEFTYWLPGHVVYLGYCNGLIGESKRGQRGGRI
jgi:hypothetical protein